jgi:hypothetical protein
MSCEFPRADVASCSVALHQHMRAFTPLFAGYGAPTGRRCPAAAYAAASHRQQCRKLMGVLIFDSGGRQLICTYCVTSREERCLKGQVSCRTGALVRRAHDVARR